MHPITGSAPANGPRPAGEWYRQPHFDQFAGGADPGDYGSEYRLTGHDLAALAPLFRRCRARADLGRLPMFTDPRRGLIDTVAPEVHALRPARAFRIDTPAGSLHGGEDSHLLIDPSGALAVLADDELAGGYQPVDPPVPDHELPPWAARLAAGLLADTGELWRHTVTVARLAELLTPTLPPGDGPLLVAAAWLHAIGHAPVLAATGLHHLDAALAIDGVVPDRLVGLVAHHTAGDAEAELRHMSIALDCFPGESSPLSDALTYADLTAGPDGTSAGAEERTKEGIACHGRRTSVAPPCTSPTQSCCRPAPKCVTRWRSSDRRLLDPTHPHPPGSTGTRDTREAACGRGFHQRRQDRRSDSADPVHSD